MNGYKMAAICIIIAGVLVYFGVKTRRLPLILGAICSFLLALFSGQHQTIRNQREELKAKEAEIKVRKRELEEGRMKVEGATNVAEKVREIQTDETNKPERKESPAHGDSDDRLDRLGRL